MRAIQQLAWKILGYAAAVVVATFITVALVVAVSTFPDNGRFGSYYKVINDVLGMAYIGMIMTSTYGSPGWLIAVCIAAWRAEKRKVYFVIAGGLTSLLAHFLLSGIAGAWTFGISGELGGIFVWSFIGGLCGGWAYWRVAVVRFGKWRVVL